MEHGQERRKHQERAPAHPSASLVTAPARVRLPRDASLAGAQTNPVDALVEVDRVCVPAAPDRVALAVRDVDGVVGIVVGVDVVVTRPAEDAPRPLVGRVRVPGVAVDVVVAPAPDELAVSIEDVVAGPPERMLRPASSLKVSLPGPP